MKKRDLLKFYSIQFTSNLVDEILSVLVGWELYSITKDPLVLAWVGFYQFVPVLACSPLAGVYVDRYRRSRILSQALALTAVAAVVIYFSLHNDLYLPGIYFGLFISGIARALKSPAKTALLPSLVEKARFEKALNISSSLNQSSTIAGPALAGLFLVGGRGLTNFVVLYFILQVIAALLCLTFSEEKRVSTLTATTKLTELKQGWRFTVRSPIVFPAILLDLLTVFFGGVTGLLPIFAQDILHLPDQAAGWLRLSPAIGSLSMALALGILPARFSVLRNAGRNFLWAATGFAFSMLFFSLSKSLVICFAALIISGALDQISVVVRQGVINRFTPPAMLGRSLAISYIFIGASNELGEFESGLLAKWLGAPLSGAVGAILSLICIAFVFSKYKQLRIAVVPEYSDPGKTELPNRV